MRSLLIMAAAVTTATVLAGCHSNKKTQPVPAPQSARLEQGAEARGVCPEAEARPGVSEINWFQGTLEEAFARPASRHTPKKTARPLVHY
jgi:hypothetical protein